MKIEELVKYRDALDKEIDWLQNRAEDYSAPRCYLSRVDGGCERCKLCRMFVAPEYKNAWHACWHIPDEKGNTIFDAFLLREAGVINAAEYNRMFNRMTLPVLMAMRKALQQLIEMQGQ